MTVYTITVDSDLANDCESEGLAWFDEAASNVAMQICENPQFVGDHFRFESEEHDPVVLVNEYRDGCFGLYPLVAEE